MRVLYLPHFIVRYCLLLQLVSLLVSVEAYAASSVLIWPIDPVLEADQQASALWLENRGNETANLQVRVFSWTQNGFDDQYQSQRDVVGSPPVAKIEPGHKQLVRLTRTRDAPPGQELAYRVIIDEIPSVEPAGSDSEGKTDAAIRFQMRYSVPLFVYGSGLWSKEDLTRSRDPKGAGAADLIWRKVVIDGRTFIEIQNRGAVHARLTDVSFKQASSGHPIAEGLLGYVLPGSAMRWPVPDKIPVEKILQMRINGLPIIQEFAISH